MAQQVSHGSDELGTTPPVAPQPPRGYSRVAGVAYLLVILLGITSVGVIDSALLVAGDDAQTAANISAHEPLFRLGVVGALLLYVGVVVLSWALYTILKPVNESLCLLALILRCAEGVLGAATTILSLGILAALGASGQPGADGGGAVHAAVRMLLDAREAALHVVLVFVGVGGSLFCYLFFVSNIIPRLLSAWGVATYVSMFGLALLGMLWPERPPVIETVLFAAGSLFEICIGLWLLIKTIDAQRWGDCVRTNQ